MFSVPFITTLVLSFCIGCIPFAYLFVKRLKDQDIREVGSGNVGATNAARVLGRPLGLLILLLDALKGVAAAWFMPRFLAFWIEYLPMGPSAAPVREQLGLPALGLVMGIAAFIGHCYNPFLKFKGGKGVATAMGVYAIVAPKALLLTFIVCAVLLLIFRIVSLASIIGAILLPISILVFYWHEDPWARFLVTLVLGLVVVFRHRSNIKRLLQRAEPRS